MNLESLRELVSLKHPNVDTYRIRWGGKGFEHSRCSEKKKFRLLHFIYSEGKTRKSAGVGGTVSSSNLIQEGPAASVQVRLAAVVQEPGRCVVERRLRLCEVLEQLEK